MPDSFLAQLEQRTQQVKITLANLEAERTRIENQIAQLQPLVPQYDALVAAEHALAEANIPIEPAVPASLSDTPPWSSGSSGRASSWGN